MSRYWLLPIVLFAFLLEGTALQWLIPGKWTDWMRISPQLTLVIILYVAMHMHPRAATVYALVFGLLHDVIYDGFMIGPHGFAMGMTVYLAGLTLSRVKWTMFSTIASVFAAMLLFEHVIYGIYSLFQVIDLSYEWALLHIMLPNIVFHLIVALLLYYPMRVIIEKMNALPDDDI